MAIPPPPPAPGPPPPPIGNLKLGAPAFGKFKKYSNLLHFK